MELLRRKRSVLLITINSADPIIAMIGINSLATFEIVICQHSFDEIQLLELIEKNYGGEHASNCKRYCCNYSSVKEC